MLRAVAPAALILLLAACGPDEGLEPFAESRVPPALSARFLPPEGWAWGYVQAGGSAIQRYGVASPPRVPKAAMVIVPGYGESAEVWFETANDLMAEGATVWVLDRAGQGGSARYGRPRDQGDVPSFAPDVANLRALVRTVIRPAPDMPVVLLSHADGAVVALRAIEGGLKVDGLVAGSPILDGKSSVLPGWKPWGRSAPDDLALGVTHDAWRGAVRQAWQAANPDLRLSGPGLRWRTAYQAASRSVEADAGLVKADVLMLNPAPEARALCARLADCKVQEIPDARAALHLESDRWRAPYLRSVTEFVAAQVARRGQ
jgi:lysophospholipase